MAKMSLQPVQQTVYLHDPRRSTLRAEGWSYESPKYLDVYIQVLLADKHLVTLNVRVKR